MRFKLGYREFSDYADMPKYYTATYVELDITNSNNALAIENGWNQVKPIDYIEVNTDVARAILRSIICGIVRRYNEWYKDASDKKRIKYKREFISDLVRIKEKWNESISTLVNKYVISFSSEVDYYQTGDATLVNKEDIINREQVQPYLQSIADKSLDEIEVYQKRLREEVKENNRKLKQLKENKLKLKELVQNNIPNIESMSDRALSVSINNYAYSVGKLKHLN